MPPDLARSVQLKGDPGIGLRVPGDRPGEQGCLKGARGLTGVSAGVRATGMRHEPSWVRGWLWRPTRNSDAAQKCYQQDGAGSHQED